MMRVLIVDDHAVVRYGLRYMLSQYSEIEVVGECEDGEQAVSRAPDLVPDVILLDLILPHMDGVHTVRELKRLVPNTQVIVLTSYDDDTLIYEAVKAGALSYLLKEASPIELVEAIKAAARGESRLHPRVAARLLHEMREQRESALNDLTAREMEVLTHIARGQSNTAIAAELTISEPTVRMHVANVLSKLHLADRTQAAIFALQKRIVPLDDPRNKRGE